MPEIDDSKPPPRDLPVHPSSHTCVSSQAQKPSQRVAPFVYRGSGEEALADLRRILESMVGVKITTATDNYLRAEFTSLLFRFIDDLELLLSPDEGVIHVRSASRVGRWDLGVNRRRVEDLRRRLGGGRL